jgi:hypothetical protein
MSRRSDVHQHRNRSSPRTTRSGERTTQEQGQGAVSVLDPPVVEDHPGVESNELRDVLEVLKRAAAMLSPQELRELSAKIQKLLGI